MEQSIDPSIQPVPAAGTDPAFIPGLTPPRPAPTQEEASSAPAAEEKPQENLAGSGEEDETPAGSADAPEEDAESAEETDEAAPVDGPVFEAVDRRGSIRVDHTGVLFRLDDQEADFTWDEVGAVEVETPRFGKRFTVIVHVDGTRRRSYTAEVDAPSRSRLKEWEAQLDAVLDAYFDDADDEPAADETVDGSAETEPAEGAPAEDAEAEAANADEDKAETESVKADDSEADKAEAESATSGAPKARRAPADRSAGRDTPAEDAEV